MVVTGKVPDIRPYLSKACIFVAPIRLGGGMRGKILEAMAMGKAVVTTPRGASGLRAQNEKEIIIAEMQEEFADRIVELLLDKDKRERIGQSAMKMVRSEYEWELQADKYLKLYQELVKKSILCIDEQMTRQGGGSNCLFNFIMRVNREKFLPIIASPEGDLVTRFQSEGGKAFITVFPRIWRVSLKIGKLKFFNPLALFVNIIRLLPLAGRLRRIIKEEKIDLLHTNSFRAHLAGFLAARISRRPIIWHLREVPRRESIFIRLIGSRYVNGLIFMSKAIQSAYLQGKGPDKRMAVIYDGITANGCLYDTRSGIRGGLGIPVDIPVIGIVGRLVPIKGHRYFVDAAKRVVESIKGVRFLVVGSNLNQSSEEDFSRTIQSMVKEMRLSEYFTFTGFHPEPLKVISAIDILVCPSIEEGFGMAVLEAIACGVPVIASDVGGIPEILRGGGGILVPPRDSESIASEVVRLLRNPDEYRRISIDGKRNALKNFPIELTVQKIEEFYKEILGECKRR